MAAAVPAGQALGGRQWAAASSRAASSSAGPGLRPGRRGRGRGRDGPAGADRRAARGAGGGGLGGWPGGTGWRSCCAPRRWPATGPPRRDPAAPPAPTCHSPGTAGRPSRPSTAPGLVQCLLCAHGCVLAEGERGRCRARINVRRRAAQPRLRPARSPCTSTRSRRSPSTTSCPARRPTRWPPSGCPLRCKFCQNWEISQARPRTTTRPFVAAGDDGRARAAARRAPGHRLHLQRADRLHRVPRRHRARGAAARAALGARLLRLHERGAARRDVRGARRDQDRPQGLQRRSSTASVCERRAGAGAAQHQAGRARAAGTSRSSTSSCRRSTTRRDDARRARANGSPASSGPTCRSTSRASIPTTSC